MQTPPTLKLFGGQLLGGGLPVSAKATPEDRMIAQSVRMPRVRIPCLYQLTLASWQLTKLS